MLNQYGTDRKPYCTVQYSTAKYGYDWDASVGAWLVVQVCVSSHWINPVDEKET